MKKLLILLMAVFMTTSAMAESQFRPGQQEAKPESKDTVKSIQVDCITTEKFEQIAVHYGLRMLSRFQSSTGIVVVFVNLNLKNWLVGFVEKTDAKTVCIYQNGNGLDLNKDFIFLDPRDNVKA
jgi:hypothetical protein